ncbi:hypothetical protein [Georgenia sp. SUBG003]|uniref:hypothetical protein n=1 Tax=Georgenia sp. SUBG003 TaxID=1497974 RepID=UPI003AB258F6
MSTTTSTTPPATTSTPVFDHSTLECELIRRTDALLAAVAAQEPHEPPLEDLVTFLHQEVLPHMEAEEEILHGSPAGAPTALLARAVTAQHGRLTDLVAEVGAARTGIDAVRAASAVVALFIAVADAEDALLLPSLTADGASDLAPGVQTSTAHRTASRPPRTPAVPVRVRPPAPTPYRTPTPSSARRPEVRPVEGAGLVEILVPVRAAGGRRRDAEVAVGIRAPLVQGRRRVRLGVGRSVGVRVAGEVLRGAVGPAELPGEPRRILRCHRASLRWR